MKNKKYTILSAIVTSMFASIILSSCESSNSPGVEYMPDMYRSPAIEAYVDYEFPDSATTMQAPENSIPRGYKPFPYPNTLEGHEMAGEQLVNPLTINEKTLKEGQLLFSHFCAHCHGAKGDGKGSITNPIYGAVPSYADKTPNRRGNRSMSELKAGHIYHTIMYGLNAMGPHSSQIREQDRWKIVAYVKTLQHPENKDGKDKEESKMEAEVAKETTGEGTSVDQKADSVTTSENISIER